MWMLLLSLINQQEEKGLLSKPCLPIYKGGGKQDHVAPKGEWENSGKVR